MSLWNIQPYLDDPYKCVTNINEPGLRIRKGEPFDGIGNELIAASRNARNE